MALTEKRVLRELLCDWSLIRAYTQLPRQPRISAEHSRKWTRIGHPY
jgi:hypothetical protein